MQPTIHGIAVYVVAAAEIVSIIHAVSQLSSKPLPLGLWQWLRCRRVEAIKCSISKDLELAEAARLERFVLPPLSLSLGLVRHLEVLGREQFVRMLGV